MDNVEAWARGIPTGCGPGGCEPDANTAQPISSISMFLGLKVAQQLFIVRQQARIELQEGRNVTLESCLATAKRAAQLERGRRLAGDAGSETLMDRVHAEQSLIEIDCKGEVN